ncbi:MAG: protein kinase [Luteolibacter sp.]
MNFPNPSAATHRNRYEKQEQIHQGGYGISYRAFDTRMNREVALKCIHDHKELPDTIVQAVNALAALQHPNIATIYDINTNDQEPYLVLELLSGKPTIEWISRQPLLLEDFREVATQIMDALIATQKLGLIHLNFKPDNLLLSRLPSGKIQVKIVDYGLARAFPFSLKDFLSKPELDPSIYCMAPEQLENQATDVRTDLYSLGCVYYYLLSGVYPTYGESNLQVVAAHIHHFIRPLQEVCSDIPLWLCDWVMWHMNLSPEDRPQSAEEALKVFLSHDALPDPPLSSGSADRSEFLKWAHRTSAHLLRIDPPADPKQVLKTQAASPAKKGAPVPRSPAPTPRAPVSSPRSKTPTAALVSSRSSGVVKPPTPAQTTSATNPRPRPVRTSAPQNRRASQTTVTASLLPPAVNRQISLQKNHDSFILKLKIGAFVLVAALLVSYFGFVQPRIRETLTVNRILEAVSSGNTSGVLLDSDNLNLLLTAVAKDSRKTQRLTIYHALAVTQAKDDTDVDRRILQFITRENSLPEGVRAGLISQVIQKHNNPDMISKLRDFASETDDRAAASAANVAANAIRSNHRRQR